MVRYDEYSAPLPDRALYLKCLGLDEADFPLGDAAPAAGEGAAGEGAAAGDAAAGAATERTLEQLNQLIFAHQTRVPFDAIDPHDFGKPASLHIDVLFDKIIRGPRGGFCFELGALFGALLAELGFRTAPCIARNVRGQEDFPPIMHRAELVDIAGQRYYADVGYGGPMAACAIPVRDGAQIESCGQRFTMRKVECPERLVLPFGMTGRSGAGQGGAGQGAADPWWLIEYQTKSMDAPAPLMYFIEAAMKPQDFEPLSFYCSAFPESVFVVERLVNRRLPDGNVNIRNDVYTRTTAAGTERRILQSADELNAVLREEFGIVVDIPAL